MTKKLFRIIVLAFLIMAAPLTVFHVEAADGDTHTITFHSNSGTGPEHEGTFEGGATVNTATFANTQTEVVAYSHTSNVDDTGKKLSNYGNSWTNTNIRGTGRTSASSQAHVITIDGAQELTVDLYFNGESANFDWVSVWYDSYPSYTAANYGTSAGKPTTDMGAPNSTNKYGGSSLSGVTFGTYTVNGNTLTNMGHVTLTLPGDSVTFAFKSDGSGCGNGYGYYAIVKATVGEQSPEGYKEPSASTLDYVFDSWNDAPDGSGSTVTDFYGVTADTDLYAVYRNSVVASGTYGCAWKLRDNGTLEIGAEGQTCTLNSPVPSSTSYQNWPWYNNRKSVKSVEIKGTVNAGASLYGMFYDQSNLTNIDFTGFHTDNTRKMGYLFRNCSSLTDLDLSSFDTSNVTDMQYMFYDCSVLTSLDLSSFDTSNVTDMSYMFCGCFKLISLDVSDFDTSAVTDMSYMFYDCSSLTSLNLSGFSTSKVTNMSYVFHNCSTLTSLNLSSFDTSKVTNMAGIFEDCSKLTALDITSFDTSNVTNMDHMFDYCKSLTNLNLSSFDTSKVTRMGYMFDYCKSLTNLNLSSFDTSNVTNMNQMFYECSALTNLDLSSFDTSNVTDMRFMFRNCSSLTSLDLSGFDTSNVTDMHYLFYSCSSLTALDLSGFDTSKVTDMNQMFSHCSSINSLDLSGFDTSKVTDMSYMLDNTTALKSIYLPKTFAFNGNGTITGTNRAFLNSNTSTQKWHRIYDEATLSKDNSGNLYTAQELTDAWDQSMAGLWVWESEDISSSGFGDDTFIHSKDLEWSKLNQDTWKYTFNVFDDTIDYYLTEDSLSGFVSDIDPAKGYVEIENKETHITNTSTTRTGSLSIIKHVTGTQSDEKFPIRIRLNGQGIPEDGIKIVGDIVFTNGEARIFLADGETKTIEGIPEGVTYEVIEETPPYYDMTGTGLTGTITEERSLAILNNAYNVTDPDKTVDIIVAKTVNSAFPDPDQEFTFTAFFDGLQPVKAYEYGTNNTFNSDANGLATVRFMLKKDENISFAGIPVGASYQISEDGGDYLASYTITDASDLGQVARNAGENTVKQAALSTELEKADENEDVTVTFNNIIRYYSDLEIKKVVSDGSTTEFEFILELQGLEPSKSYNSNIGRIVADDEGKTEKEFYLSGGSEIKIEGLPVGATYSITEQPSLYYASFAINDGDLVENNVTKKELSTGTQTILKEKNSVVFTNHTETGTLEIKKTLENAQPEDNDRDFEFEITLEDSGKKLSGDYRFSSEIKKEMKPIEAISYIPHYGMQINFGSNTRTNGPLMIMWKDKWSGEWMFTGPSVSSGTTLKLLSNEAYLLYRSYGAYYGLEIDSVERHAGTDWTFMGAYAANTKDTQGALTELIPRYQGSNTYYPTDLTLDAFVNGSNGYHVSVADADYNNVPTYQFVKVSIEDNNEPVTSPGITAEQAVAALGYKVTFGEDTYASMGPFEVFWQTEDGFISIYGPSSSGGTVNIPSKKFWIAYANTNAISGSGTGRSGSITPPGFSVAAIEPIYEETSWANGNKTTYTTLEDFINASFASYYGGVEIKDGRNGVNATGEKQVYEFDFSTDAGSRKGTVEFNGLGKATILLRPNETFTIANLPEGLSYRISEKDYSDEGYNLVASSGSEGTIAAGQTSSASFTNRNDSLKNITIEKTVDGNMGNKHKPFGFTLSAENLSPGTSYSGTKNDGMTFTLTADGNGDATVSFTLTHGENVTFAGLPYRANLTVSETDYTSEGYRTYINNSLLQKQSITFTPEEVTEIVFLNVSGGIIPTEVRLPALSGAFVLSMAAGIIIVLEEKKKLKKDKTEVSH